MTQSRSISPTMTPFKFKAAADTSIFPPGRFPGIFLGTVLLITFLAHASYIPNGLVWLDHGDIEEGGRAVVPLSHLGTAFFTHLGNTGFYRPLITILHSFDFTFHATQAAGFHLTNVLLHTAVTASVFFFACYFFNLAYYEGLFVALVFGIHPLSWLPVGAISYRSEPLVMLFTLFVLIFHIKARRHAGDIKWYRALAAVSFLLALFSKEPALIWVPALIGLWEWARITEHPICWRADRWLWGSEILMVIVYLLLRHGAVPEGWHTTSVNLPFVQAIATRLAVVGSYMKILFVPFKPRLSDATPVIGLGHPSVIGTLLFLMGVSVLVLRRNTSLTVRLLLGYLFVTLVPALNIIPLPRFSSPHYLYIAAIVPGIIGVLTLRFLKRISRSVFMSGVLIVLIWIGVMTVATFSAGFNFRNDLTLFKPEVERDPHFREGHYYLGNYFFMKKDIEQAGHEYEAALRGDPDFLSFVDTPSLIMNFAALRLSQNRLQEADELFLLIEKSKDMAFLPSVHYNRALIAWRGGDYQRVISLLKDDLGLWRRPEPALLYQEALKRMEMKK